MKRLLHTTTIFLALALVLGFLLPANKAQAQINYTYTGPAGGNPGGVNAEIDDNVGGWAPIMNLNFVGVNQWSAAYSIPFKFRFYNNVVTQFMVSANGVLTFDVNTMMAPPGNNIGLPTNTLPDSSIACMWDQFTNAPPMGADDVVHMKTFGTVGYRQLWIRWTSCERNNNTSITGVTNAIVLVEGTNQIFIVDMIGAGGLSATTGIQLNSWTGTMAGAAMPGLNANNANGNNVRYGFTPSMLGQYTIGGTNPDYTTLNLASRALSTCGVGGAVDMVFRNGSYSNKDTIDHIPWTTTLNTVTFRSESGNKSLVNIAVPSDAAPGSNHAVAINNADFVIFRDLTFWRSGSSPYGTAIELTGNATNIRFANCGILGSGNTGTNTDRVGVYTISGSLANISIDSCTINNVATGLYINPAGTASGISIKDNTITGGTTGWAVMLANSPQAVVRGNTMTSNATVPTMLVNNCDGAIDVARNYCLNYVGVAASFLNCDGLDGFVYNNIFRSIANTATAAALLITTCTNMNYDHNTCYTTNTNAAGAALTIDAAVGGGASVRLRNNIFANMGAGFAVEETNAGDTYIALMRNNLFYTAGANFYLWNGGTGNTGPGFEAATAFADIGNVYGADPLFVNPSSDDFKLQLASPARNAGFTLSLPTADFEGLPRPINVMDPASDMGAHEYICTPALSGTYVIGATGDFLTMAAARDALNCGITGPVRFRIQAGTYNIKELVLPHIFGTSATDTILFETFSGAQDVVFNRAASDGQEILNINGLDYATFKNLHFRTTGGINSRKITIQNNSSNIRFVDCLFETDVLISAAASTGGHIFMNASGSDNLLVQGCQFLLGSHALFVNGSSNVRVLSNDINVATIGIELQSTTSPTVSRNQIQYSGTNNVRGISLATINGQMFVEYNRVVFTGTGLQNAIHISGFSGSSGIVGNNMLAASVNNGTDGVLFLSNVSNLMVAYNSVRNNSTIAGSNAMHVTGSGTSNSNNFYYNILQSETTPALEVTGAMTTSIDMMDQNIYFTGGAVLGRWNGANRTNMALWQSISGKDPNSIQLNPQFASATDLHIGGGSPAIAQITSPVVDYQTDIDGAPRTLPTDIGADHFNCPTRLTGTYTIGATGDYTTFADAAYDLWRCGISGNVVFEFQPGIYSEQVILRDYPRDAPTDSVIFQGFGTAQITHPSSPSPADNYIVKVEEAQNVTFDGLSFDRPGGDDHAICLELYGNTERLNILNCNFANGSVSNDASQQASLIRSSYCAADTVRILNCGFNGGTDGIVLYGSYTMSGLHIEGNNFNNFTNDGIFLAGTEGGQIVNNSFIPNGEAVNGIHLYQSEGPVRIDRNLIKAIQSGAVENFYGIWIDTQMSTVSDPTVVSNNVVIVNGTSIYLSYGIGCQFSDHIRVQHNSVSLVTSVPTMSAAFWAGQNNTNLTVQNNSWAAFNATNAVAYHASSIVGSNVQDKNLLYSNGPIIGNWGGSSIFSFASWQSTTSRDANSISANPLYTANSSDLTINASSPLYNVGLVITDIAVDQSGGPRSMDVDCPKRDMGAYEVGCVNPLSGYIFVGASFPPFTSPAAAMSMLNECGVGGPVVFSVDPGTYTEKLVIEQPCNGSATNTVTFMSSSGVATDVVITSASSVANAQNYTLLVDKADYINFENITFERTGSNEYASVVHLYNGSDNLSFFGVRFVSDHTAPSGINQSLVYGSMNSLALNNHYFTSCSFEGGYAGLRYGAAAAMYNVLEVFECSFTEQRGFGIAIFNSFDNVLIRRNDITTTEVSGTYTGIYSQAAERNHAIQANRVLINPPAFVVYGAVGIHMIGNPASVGGYMLNISNNEVNLNGDPLGGSLGLFLNNCRDFTILYNTVAVASSAAAAVRLDHNFGGAPNSSIYNNIFVHRYQTSLAADYRVNAMTWVGSNISHNLYYNGYTGSLVKHGAVTYAHATDWVYGSGLEATVYEQDPNFFSDDNLEPQPTSIVSRLGLPLGGNDRLGVARSSTAPSLGAYEVVCSGLPYDGAYTVGLTGDFLNLNAAIGALNQCGMSGAVTLDIQTGTYNERVTIGPILGLGATPDDTLTLQALSGNPEDVVITQPAGHTKDLNYTIGVYQSGFVTIHDLTLARTGILPYSTAVRLFEAEKVHLYHDIINTEGTNGGAGNCEAIASSLGPLLDIRVEGCTIAADQGGIHLAGSSTRMLEDILVRDNDITFDLWAGIEISTAERVNITGNSVVSNTTFTLADGINLYYIYDQGQVVGNFVKAEENGLYIVELDSYSSGFMISNNVVVQHGYEIGAAMFIQDVVFADILHNTLVSYGEQYSAALQLYAASPLSFDCSIYNNILANLGDGVALSELTEGETMIAALDYNLYYAANNDIVSFDAATYTNLGDFFADLGHEPNGVAGNPLFANAPSDNYRLTGASPAVGAAIFVGITEDFDGETRNNPTAIGAFELLCSPLAGTYAVGPTGDYLSIQAAVEALVVCGMSAAVTFELENGTFNEPLVIDAPIAGLSYPDTLLFTSQSGNPTDVIITRPSSSVPDTNYTVYLNNSQFVTIRNLTLQRTPGGGYSTVVQIGDGNDYRLEGNIIDHQGIPTYHEDGCAIYSNADLLAGLQIIGNNISAHNGGIVLLDPDSFAGANDVLIADNHISVTDNGIGIRLENLEGVVIADNYIADTLTQDMAQAVVLSYLREGLTVNNNFISGRDVALRLEYYDNGSELALIYNNVMEHYGMDQIALHILESTEAEIYHNTLVSRAGTWASAFTVEAYSVYDNDITIYNNIFASIDYGFAMRMLGEGHQSVASMDYNLYYSNYGGGDYIDIENVFYVTLSEVFDNYGFDEHGMQAYPDFVDAANHDYHVTPCSPAIGAGFNLGLATDYYDAARPANPTIGAIEGTACSGPLAGSYTIGTTGDFATISYAICALKLCGVSAAVVFDIEPGVYNEQLYIPYISGTSSANTITFQGVAANRAAVQVVQPAGTDLATDFVLKIEDAAHLRFQDLTLGRTGANTHATPVQLIGIVDDVVFNNDSLFNEQGTDTLLVVFGTATNLIINNNHFTGGAAGLHHAVGYLQYAQITNNTFQNQTDVGIWSSEVITRNRVDNNIFGTTAALNDGIGFASGYGEVSIQNNKVFFKRYGITVSGLSNASSDSIIVANNIVVDDATDGTGHIGLRFFNSAYVYVAHNSVYISNGNAGSVPFMYAGGFGTATNKIYNNIFANLGAGFVLSVGSGGASHILQSAFNRNILYAASNPNPISWGVASYTSIALWRASHTSIPNTQSGDNPLWVSPPSNFAVQSCSYALNGGISSGYYIPTTDFQGTSRNLTHPTIGAIEVVACGTPLAGNYTIGATGDYLSFNAAQCALRECGVGGAVLFSVQNGTYNEQLKLDGAIIPGLNATNTVTFRGTVGSPGNVVLQRASSVSNVDNYVLQLLSASYLRFEHMSFGATGANSFARLIDISGTTTDVQFTADSLFIQSANDYHFYHVGNTDGLTIHNCSMLGGYVSYQHTSGTFANSALTNNRLHNPANSGIVISGPSVFTNVSGNKVGISAAVPAGILLLNGNGEVRVLGNQVYHKLQGVRLLNIMPVASDSIIVANNIIYDESADAAIHYGLYLSANTNLYLAHNSVRISNNNINSVVLNMDGGGIGPSNRIYNNIFRMEGNDGRCVVVDADAALDVDLTAFSHNYITRVFGNAVEWEGNSYFSVANWLLAYPSVPNTQLVGTPLWVAPNTNFAVQPRSLAWRGSATGLGYDPATDFNGSARDAIMPTIGAVEFTFCRPHNALAGSYLVGAGQTLTNANDAASVLQFCGISAPTELRFLSGTYSNQQLRLESSIPGLNATDTLLFTSNTGNRADVILQYPASASNNFPVIYVAYNNHITFRNLTIKRDGNNTYAPVVQLSDGASYIRFDGDSMVVEAASPTEAKHFEFRSCNNITVQNCDLRGGTHGFNITDLYGATQSVTIRNNTLRNLSYAMLWAEATTGNNHIFDGNSYIPTGASPYYGVFIDDIGTARGIKITNNAIRFRNTGIHIQNITTGASDSLFVANNTIATYNADAGVIFGVYIASASSGRTRLYHNTIYVTNGTANPIGVYSQNSCCTPGNMSFINNLVQMPDGGTGLEVLSSAINVFSATSLTNNGFDVNSATVVKWDGTNYASVAAWNAATSRCNNCTEGPLHFAAAPNNFNIAYCSAGAGTGTPLAQVPLDLISATRSVTNPSMGALEAPSCSSPLVAGNYTIGGGGDYATITEAVCELTACGITGGPVRMRLASGTYTEKVFLQPISGTSATDTVTFESQTGNYTDVIITQPSSATAGNNFAISLASGTSYITLKDLTLTRTGTNAFADIVVLAGNNQSVHFINDSLNSGSVTAGKAGIRATINAPDLLVQNCRFTTMGIGVEATGVAYPVTMRNCQFRDMNTNALSITSTGATPVRYVVNDNVVHPLGTSMSHCIRIISNGFGYGEFLRNKLRFNTSGIYLQNMGNVGDSIDIVNNVAATYTPVGGTIEGISLQNCDERINIFHNTAYIVSNSAASAAVVIANGVANTGVVGMYLENNIMYCQGSGKAFRSSVWGGSYINISRFNYNSFYSTNAGFPFTWNSTQHSLINFLVSSGNSNPNRYFGPLSFVSAPDDLTLNACSPSARLGTAKPTVPTDILGVTRSGALPTAGAYEYVGSGPAMVGTYLVGSGEALTTLNQAVCALRDRGMGGAVTLSVKPGTYNEQVEFTEVGGMSLTDSLVVESQTGMRSSVVITSVSATVAAMDYTILVNNPSSLTLRNLTLTRTGVINQLASVVNYQGAGRFRMDGDSLWSQYLTTPNTTVGCFTTGADCGGEIIIENCNFAQGRDGIRLNHNLLNGMTVRKNFFGIFNATNGNGIQIITQSHGNLFLIEDNVFGDPGLGIYPMSGVYFNTANVNAIVRRNTIYFNNRAVSLLNSNPIAPKRILVENNLMVENPSGPTTAIGVNGTSASNFTLYYNTIVMENPNTAVQGLVLSPAAATPANVEIQNNNFHMLAGRCINTTANGTGRINTALFSNNNFFTLGPTTITWSSANYPSFADWRTAFPALSPNSMSVEPQYQSGTDYRLLNSSLLIKAGTPVAGLTLDRDSLTRHSTQPTIGCYEPYCPAGPLAGTYGIGASGDFTTITDAVGELYACGINAPVRMEIEPGTYTENISMRPVEGTNASDTIVFVSQTQNPADVEVTQSSGDYVWSFENTDYVTLEALLIKPTGSMLGGIRLVEECNNIRFIGDSLHTDVAGAVGIRLTGAGSSSDLQIVNSSFTGVGQAIFLNPTDSISNLVIRDNRFSGQHQSVSVLDIRKVRNLKLTRNQVFSNTETDGLTLTNIRGEIIVEQNDIFAEQNPLVFSAVHGAIGQAARFVNNVFNSINSDGYPASAMSVVASSHLDFYHNTFNIDNTSGGTATVNIDNITVPASVNFVNNVVKSDITNLPLNVTPAATGGFNAMDHNLYYASGSSEFAYWGVSTAFDLIDLQGFSGLDANSLEADPQFTSALNLKPVSGSPVESAGTPIGVLVDILDSSRSATVPSIGAYEVECAPLAGTYVIGSGGDFATISQAVARLVSCGISAPVRMEIESGYYTEQISIPAISGTNASDTILFVSQSGIASDVTIDVASSVSPVYNYVWQFYDADYITLQALTLKRSGTDFYSKVVEINEDARHIRLLGDSLIAENHNDALIGFEGSGRADDLQVRGCKLQNGFKGINSNKPDSLSQLVVDQNSFIDQEGTAISLSFVQQLQITRNIVLNSAYGFDIFGLDSTVNISQNDIVADQVGMLLTNVFGTATNPIQIVNNVVKITAGVNKSESAIQIAGLRYVDVYHNSFRMINSNTAPALFLASTSANGSVNVVNNVFYTDGAGAAIQISNSAMLGLGIIDHNIYFTTGSDIGFWGLASATTLGDWQTFTGQDANSKNADPLFTSATDLTPQGGSPVTAGGSPVGVLTDFLDDARSLTTPSIGAYEIDCPTFVINTTQSHVSCNGSDDGFITVFVSGGAAPYEYSLDNFATSQLSDVFYDLFAGIYTVYVKDANGCVTVSDSSYTIYQPLALTIDSATPTYESCFASGDGFITVTVSGGVPPYSYSLNGGTPQASGTFTGLGMGTYHVGVSDANFCYTDLGGIELVAPTGNMKLSVKAFLEGPYLPGPQLMGDSLNKAGFGILDSLYLSTGIRDTSGAYPDTLMLPGYSVPVGAVDVVMVELRDDLDPTIVVDSALGWLLTDGMVLDFRTGQNAYLSFCGASSGNYHVVVRHRNHLPIMSASSVFIDSDPPIAPIDMTIPANLYGGTDAAKVVGGKALMYAGNAYDDPVFDWGEINANDFFMVIIDSDFPSQPHYIKTDVNLDGKLNALDFDIVSWNNDNLYRTYVPR